MEKIDIIQNELREGKLNNNPSLCAENVAYLSGELSFYIGMQSDIEKDRADNWLDIRKNCKSDNQADKTWLRTSEGREYEWYESRIKRCKTLIQGLRTIIRKCELEMQNIQ